MDKIERNCHMLGLVTSRPSSVSLIASGITITYVDASIQGPMGGVDGAVSPFLGIGIANPGQLQLSANPATLAEFQVLRVVCGMANDVVIPAGLIHASSDMLGLGQ